jgi:plasmid stabilization system protein ParE
VKTYSVVFAPEAQDDLVEILEYISGQGSPAAAARYAEAIVAHCEALSSFPHRGTPRSDIRPGLRVTNYRGRAVIAFEVDDAAGVVSVLGVFYGGRDVERALSGEADPGEALG